MANTPLWSLGRSVIAPEGADTPASEYWFTGRSIYWFEYVTSGGGEANLIPIFQNYYRQLRMH